MTVISYGENGSRVVRADILADNDTDVANVGTTGTNIMLVTN